MARPPRIDFPGVPQHLMIRGNNHTPFFFTDRDRQVFLRYLGDAKETCGCDVHAYVLMTNHVHLLATGNSSGAISRLMQAIGRRYARYANRAHSRTGTLFEGRFKSSLVCAEEYFLICMRYIELNPVRASMAAHPGDYPWSSFHQNAGGAPSGLLKPQFVYLGLGSDPAARGMAYRALFAQAISDSELAAIRASLAKDRALGSDAFVQGLEAALGMDLAVVEPGRPRGGRPKK